jgi:hypothetical protein
MVKAKIMGPGNKIYKRGCGIASTATALKGF